MPILSRTVLPPKLHRLVGTLRGRWWNLASSVAALRSCPPLLVEQSALGHSTRGETGHQSLLRAEKFTCDEWRRFNRHACTAVYARYLVFGWLQFMYIVIVLVHYVCILRVLEPRIHLPAMASSRPWVPQQLARQVVTRPRSTAPKRLPLPACLAPNHCGAKGHLLPWPAFGSPIPGRLYSIRSREPVGSYRAGASRLQPPLRRPNPSTVPATPTAPPTSPVSNVPAQVPVDPHGVLQSDAPASVVLANSALVVTRQLEMLNVLVGFEQANKYAIVDPQGNPAGFIAEEDTFANSLSRQFLRTHRQFKATILDKDGNVVLTIHRPFSWINSRIYVKTPNGEVIGEVHQEWHLWKRRYDLFVRGDQFARIDGSFLTWDFDMVDDQGHLISSVNRNFSGFAREIFTDTGQYVLRMDAAAAALTTNPEPQPTRALTLDERAVALACAVTIDIDYFSRHSSHGSGGLMPFPIFFPGYGAPPEPSETASASQSPEPGHGPQAPSTPGYGGYGTETPPDDPFLPDDLGDDDDGGGFFEGDSW
ncbi:hypothetical protein H4R35_004383 [Dimargaris xerosporica]|nr:hypothetical protein H4R35_004383 [Dimargaris xerosporica]